MICTIDVMIHSARVYRCCFNLCPLTRRIGPNSLGVVPVAAGAAGKLAGGASRRRSPCQVLQLGCAGPWHVPAMAFGPGAGPIQTE